MGVEVAVLVLVQRNHATRLAATMLAIVTRTVTIGGTPPFLLIGEKTFCCFYSFRRVRLSGAGYSVEKLLLQLPDIFRRYEPDSPARRKDAWRSA